MWSFIQKHFAKGWVKAAFIALPATLAYGPLIFIGLYVSYLDIFTLNESYDQKTAQTFAMIMVLAPCGLLGLVGAWLAFLFQEKLKAKVTVFNKLVSVLLFAGVLGVVGVILYLGPEIFIRPIIRSITGESLAIFFYYIIFPSIIALYGLYLAINISRIKFSVFQKTTN